MKIAIWTKSPPKVEAIKSSVKDIPYFINEKIVILTESVSSDVSDMPLSLDENMDWAENRAKNLVKKWIQADLYIGMEWGTSIINWKAYLFGVVYVFDGKEWHFGISNMLEIPEKIKTPLYEEWKELWPLMSAISGEENLWHKNWTFWMLSDNILLRSEQFIIAFKSAICPFYNKYYK